MYVEYIVGNNTELSTINIILILLVKNSSKNVTSVIISSYFFFWFVCLFHNNKFKNMSMNLKLMFSNLFSNRRK